MRPLLLGPIDQLKQHGIGDVQRRKLVKGGRREEDLAAVIRRVSFRPV